MPVTPAHCGHNQEVHAIAGGQGDAPNPILAMLLAFARFADSFVSADASLKAYAAQACPADCPVKSPAAPGPVYDTPLFNLNYHPAKPAQPARLGHPAIPAHPASWSCEFGLRGVVTFDCDQVEG